MELLECASPFLSGRFAVVLQGEESLLLSLVPHLTDKKCSDMNKRRWELMPEIHVPVGLEIAVSSSQENSSRKKAMEDSEEQYLHLAEYSKR